MTLWALTNAATISITLEQIAQEAGIAHQSLKAYRQAEGNVGRRTPSPDAQKAIAQAIAKLARAQAKHFEKLAQRAEKEA